MKRIYLATPISTIGEKEWSKTVAKRLRGLGFEVYAPAENNSINDKNNQPTPADIYKGDIDQLLMADIVVANITGGLQDGTVSEIGFISGWNEATESGDNIELVAFSSSERLNQPQFYKNIASAGANHLVLGHIDVWGKFVGNTDEMLEYMGTIYGVTEG